MSAENSADDRGLAALAASTLPRPDAYVEWARRTGFQDVGGLQQGGWLSVIMELHCPARQFANEVTAHPELATSIRVPAHYADPAKGIDDARFCTASVSEEFLRAMLGAAAQGVAQATAIARIKRFEIGFASQPAQAHAIAPLRGLLSGKGKAKVIVAVIDDGLAFANERFCRRVDGRRVTRMACLWNQDDQTAGATAWGYGREHDAHALNACIEEAAHDGRLDEARVYALANYACLRRRATHGTHVMDLACGMSSDEATDEAPAIIGVQLPTQSIEDTSCGSLGVSALDALRYILKRADEIGTPDCTLLVNLSYGGIAGPHDGSSIFEGAVEELTRLRRAFAHKPSRPETAFQLIMPAGNSYLLRCHWHCDRPAERKNTLTWRVLPDDGTPSFLEIWFAKHVRAADVVVSVESPAGEVLSNIGAGETRSMQRGGGPPACVATHREDAANGDGVMILVVVAPTAPLDPAGPIAPCGVWKVTVENRAADAPMAFDAWIQRDDIAYGHRGRGRQSYFLEETYRVYDAGGRRQLRDGDSFTRRAGTLNGMATSRFTEVVGGVRLPHLRPADYTSVGLPSSRDLHTPAATLLAVTEDSPLCHGVLASGTHSGSLVALRGTSMAAPQRARELAGTELADTTPASLQALTPQQAEDALGIARPLVPPSASQAARRARRLGADAARFTNAPASAQAK